MVVNEESKSRMNSLDSRSARVSKGRGSFAVLVVFRQKFMNCEVEIIENLLISYLIDALMFSV